MYGFARTVLAAFKARQTLALVTMTKKDYKLELLAAIENNRDKDALTVTREFMAKKALDDLYANNNEGMKRLADSQKSLTLMCLELE